MGRIHIGIKDIQEYADTVQVTAAPAMLPIEPTIIEKIVHVDRPVEVIVEKLVEVPVEVIKERVLIEYKTVEVPVMFEKIVEKPIEVIKYIEKPAKVVDVRNTLELKQQLKKNKKMKLMLIASIILNLILAVK